MPEVLNDEFWNWSEELKKKMFCLKCQICIVKIRLDLYSLLEMFTALQLTCLLWKSQSSILARFCFILLCHTLYIHIYIFFKSNPYLRKKGWLYTFYWRFWKEHKPGVFGAYNGVFISLVLQYSTSRKSLIFCFALLLLQIVVNFQNQGKIWNLLVITFLIHPLHVQFDQVLAEYLSQNLVKLYM